MTIQRPFPNTWRANKEHAYTISFRYCKDKKNRTAFHDAKKSYQLLQQVQDVIERHTTNSPIRQEHLMDRTIEIIAELGIIKARRSTSDLDTLVQEYRGLLESRERNQDYVNHFCTRISRINTGCGFTTPRHIEADEVERYLRSLRNGDKKLSRKTSNEYMSAYRTWCDWLVKNGYLPGPNPVMDAEMMNVDEDIRRKRRAMDNEHYTALLLATAKRKAKHRLDDNTRVWVYRLARETGFRAAELASLTPAHFDLTAAIPVVVIEATISKHKRQDRQVIPAALVPELAAWLVPKPRDQHLFPGRWYRRAAEMLRADLSAAGIEIENERGEVYDFHSLRHSFITGLARAGVHPKKAQRLARHANISLTMNTYTHLDDADLAFAVGLASPSSPPSMPRGCSEGHSGAPYGREGEGVGEVR